MSNDLSPDQQRIFANLISALNERYHLLHVSLLEALNMLYAVVNTANDNDPRWEVLNDVLRNLSNASSLGLLLHEDVTDVLYRQLMQSQSSKLAYEHGWQDRLRDMIAGATPAQLTVIENLITDLPGD